MTAAITQHSQTPKMSQPLKTSTANNDGVGEAAMANLNEDEHDEGKRKRQQRSRHAGKKAQRLERRQQQYRPERMK